MKKILKLLYKKQTLILTGIIMLVAASFIGLSFHAGIKDVLNRMMSANAVWLLLIVGAQSIAYWAYVVPYKHVFKIGYKEAVLHSFEGFHPMLPGGGFRYDIAAHCSLGEKARAYYLSLWEYAALAPVIMVAAIYAVVHGGVPYPLSLPWVIGVPAGSGLFALGVIFRDRISRFPKAHRILDFMLNMLRQQDKKEIGILMAGMVMYWAGEIFALWGALQLFQVHLDWFALLIAYATGYVISRRSMPLGGAGIVLIMLAFSLHWVGAALSVALLAALAYQVSNLLMPALYRRAAISSP